MVRVEVFAVEIDLSELIMLRSCFELREGCTPETICTCELLPMGASGCVNVQILSDPTLSRVNNVLLFYG